MKSRHQSFEMSPNKEILLQTLKGYSETNRITAQERYTRLRTRTTEENLKIFITLYRTWEQSGKKVGGNDFLLAKRRVNDHIHLRSLLKIAAEKRGDI